MSIQVERTPLNLDFFSGKGPGSLQFRQSQSAEPLVPLDAAFRIVVSTAGYDVVTGCVPLALRQA